MKWYSTHVWIGPHLRGYVVLLKWGKTPNGTGRGIVVLWKRRKVFQIGRP